MQRFFQIFFLIIAISHIAILSAFASANELLSASKALSLPTEQLIKVWDSNDLSTVTRSTTEPVFAVYSGNSGKGFAIVSGEMVLGYSYDNEISSPDKLPLPMREYLIQLEEQLRSSALSTKEKAPGNVVVQIETAKWAQGDPYNRLCPTKNGSKCLTGCIPTAFAIVMRYHKWPNQGTGKVYNPMTGEAVNISEHTYNWDEMPMEYSYGNYTETQANEVASLMMHLGYAYMVSYGTSNTSGNHNSYILAKYFNYVDVGVSQRWQVGDSEWVRLIKESLDNGCPIPYAATNSGTGDSKHIFVLDGYTDNNYYHFNWGWGGNGNGYFLLSSMTPSTGDNYSKSDTHQAYFNLRPNRVLENYTISVSATEGGTATLNGVSSVTVKEGSAITLVAVADEGYEFTGWTVNGDVVSKDATYTFSARASAEYVANFNKKEEVKKYTVSVAENSNGKVYIGEEGVTTVEVEAGSTLTLYAIPNEGYSFVNWTVNGTEISTNHIVTITVEASAEYVANFEMISSENFSIELYSAGNGSVYIGDDKSCAKGEFEKETTVTIHAVADEGYEFDYWTIEKGGYEFPLQGAEKDATIFLLENLTLYAYFKVSTSVNDVKDNRAKVYVNENKLHLEGNNCIFRIYTNDGKKIKELFVQNISTIELPAGYYIVSLDNYSEKIIIK